MAAPQNLRGETAENAPRWLWFTIVAGPIAWAVQGLFGWWFGSANCAPAAMAGGGGLTIAETFISIGALIVVAIALVEGFRNWRRSGESTRLEDANGRTTLQYLTAAGALVSASFLVAIVWAGVGLVIVNACGSMR